MVVIVWKFFANLRPSMSVSGDFFEVLKLSDTSAGIFICDVMGHGVRAALVAPLSVLWWVNCEITWEIRVSCFPGSIGRFAQHWNYSEVPLFVSAFYLLVFRSSHERCRIAMSFDVQKGQL